MGLYRTQIVIVTDILDVVQEDTFDKDGASVTSLIRKANISHGRLRKILKNLVSQGLLEQVNSDRASKYKISMSGREFLQEYKTFSESSLNSSSNSSSNFIFRIGSFETGTNKKINPIILIIIEID